MTVELSPGYLLMIQQKRNEMWESFSPDTQAKLEKLGMKKEIPERCNCDASCGENRYHDVGSPGCMYKDNEAYYAEYPAMRPHTKTFSKKEVLSCTRPWGSWHVLDVGEGYKVKRLEILPDMAISMQYHNHRSEWWVIAQGEGKVNLGGEAFSVARGDSFYVPVGTIHKVTCTSLQESLIAIETQLGDICDEEDIVRV